MSSSTKFVSTFLGLAFAAGVSAAPVTYNIDPSHTFPSFDVDHSGGTSVWRGKFNTTSGTITMDKEARTGTVSVTIDTELDRLRSRRAQQARHWRGADQTPTMLDVAKFPTATYEGRLTTWVNGAPTKVEGYLTLHGVTKPVNLEIRSFKCGPGRPSGETCGADAYGEFNRADFGVSFGQSFGFDMGVVLRIQIEGAPRRNEPT